MYENSFKSKFLPYDYIDDEGKPKIRLDPLTNEHGTIYLGKYQIPGVWFVENGLSFMVFTHEDGAEELHVGFMKGWQQEGNETILCAKGFDVALEEKTDRHGNIYHVGSLVGPTHLDTTHGLFFQVDLANCRMLISPLDLERVKERNIARRNLRQEYVRKDSSTRKVGT